VILLCGVGKVVENAITIPKEEDVIRHHNHRIKYAADLGECI